jgi:hypothetical protein
VQGGATEAGKVYVTQRLSRLLVTAGDEAGRLKDEYVSVEHLLSLQWRERGFGQRKIDGGGHALGVRGEPDFACGGELSHRSGGFTH